MWVDGYYSTKLTRSIVVERVFTIHYFEYAKDFVFPGESHDFWELLYVDNGVVEVVADEAHHTLFKGDMIFHRPNEFHRLSANGTTAPNLVVLSYECRSPAAQWFAGKVLRIVEEERTLLGHIVHEAQSAFSSRLDDPLSKGLMRAADGAFGCEQMIRLHLEELLIRLVRRDAGLSNRRRLAGSITQRSKETAFNRVANYLEDNMGTSIRLEHLCRAVGYSRSYLYQVFRDRTGQSVMEYVKAVKVERAKQMIREGGYNIAQICDALGFRSSAHFCTLFKRYVGMTPSGYASSVKMKSERFARIAEPTTPAGQSVAPARTPLYAPVLDV